MSYQNIFNPDFLDFIKGLNEFEVDYILVGGYAVILQGYPRTTGDMDIWVEPTVENYQRLVGAFQSFGLPLFDMTLELFLDTDKTDVFSFGRPPVSIDLMTVVKGLNFKEVFQRARYFSLEDGIQVRTLHLNDLIHAKKASHRYKDLDDIEHLTEGD